MSSHKVINQIQQLFEQRGAALYGGEAVTQTEHALQAAWLAEKESADSALIAAALLHDIGHLLHDLGDDCADEGVDDVHELRGARWLSEFFEPDVVEPIRLHVPAKRYRCAVEPDYLAKLSPASVQSLKLQGGPFSPEDVERFKQLPHSDDAVRLRNWDDQAKIEHLRTPSFEEFLPHVENALKAL